MKMRRSSSMLDSFLEGEVRTNATLYFYATRSFFTSKFLDFSERYTYYMYGVPGRIYPTLGYETYKTLLGARKLVENLHNHLRKSP